MYLKHVIYVQIMAETDCVQLQTVASKSALNKSLVFFLTSFHRLCHTCCKPCWQVSTVCYPTTYHHHKSTWSCTSSTSVTHSWLGNKTMYKGEGVHTDIRANPTLFLISGTSFEKLFYYPSRLKQVLNDLLHYQQQQQQQPPQASSSSAGWQTQKQVSSQQSSSGLSASPGVFLPFSSTLHPSTNNLSTAALSPFSPSMIYLNPLGYNSHTNHV